RPLPILQRSGVDLQLDQFEYSADRPSENGGVIPTEQIAELKRDYVAFFIGALGDSWLLNRNAGSSLLQQLRLQMNLYLNYCPVEYISNRYSPLKLKNVDNVCFYAFHENLQGLSAGAESLFKEHTDEEAVMLQAVNTRRSLDLLLQYAFEFARHKGLRRISIYQQDIPYSYNNRLLKEISEQLRLDYPNLEISYDRPDDLLHRMFQKPDELEIIVSCGSFSQVINQVMAEIQGSSSLTVEGNLNPGKQCLYRPLHGPMQQIAGKDEVNPLGGISACSHILQFLGLEQESQWVNSAVKYALDTHNTTRDLGGRLSTHLVGDFITDQIRKSAHL
ncbi:hypothetical protein KKA00_03035, partial [bacterium]|nr:hypothetical protein [bacterium]